MHLDFGTGEHRIRGKLRHLELEVEEEARRRIRPTVMPRTLEPDRRRTAVGAARARRGERREIRPIVARALAVRDPAEAHAGIDIGTRRAGEELVELELSPPHHVDDLAVDKQTAAIGTVLQLELGDRIRTRDDRVAADDIVPARVETLAGRALPHRPPIPRPLPVAALEAQALEGDRRRARPEPELDEFAAGIGSCGVVENFVDEHRRLGASARDTHRQHAGGEQEKTAGMRQPCGHGHDLRSP